MSSLRLQGAEQAQQTGETALRHPSRMTRPAGTRFVSCTVAAKRAKRLPQEGRNGRNGYHQKGETGETADTKRAKRAKLLRRKGRNGLGESGNGHSERAKTDAAGARDDFQPNFRLRPMSRPTPPPSPRPCDPGAVELALLAQEADARRRQRDANSVTSAPQRPSWYSQQ